MSDKIEVIQNMLGKVDRLIIGGAMAYTFFKSRGVAVGKSLVEDDKLDAARDIEVDARRARRQCSRCRSITSSTTRSTARGRRETLPVTTPSIGDRYGRGHRADDDRALRDAARPTRRPSSGTGRWACSRSTRVREPAPTPSRRPSRPCTGTTIVGGGDSIAAVKKAGMTDRITHISTGGGASLEFLGGQRAARGVRPGSRRVWQDGQVGRPADLPNPPDHEMNDMKYPDRRQLEDVQRPSHEAVVLRERAARRS